MPDKPEGNRVKVEYGKWGPRVFIDGVEVKGLSTVSFASSNEGASPRVILAFVPEAIEVEEGLELMFDSVTINSHSWATWREPELSTIAEEK